MAGGLTGAWAFAILPNGALLVTQNSGTMRVVRPDDGSVSAPLAGVPPVKSAAAQGLHDVVLDPDFAKNRILYFTYFAPPRGEARRQLADRRTSTRTSGRSRSPNAGRWTWAPSGWRGRS